MKRFVVLLVAIVGIFSLSGCVFDSSSEAGKIHELGKSVDIEGVRVTVEKIEYRQTLPNTPTLGHLVASVKVQNNTVIDTVHPAMVSWSAKTPTGETMQALATPLLGEKAYDGTTIAPGATASGEVAFFVTNKEPGAYTVSFVPVASAFARSLLGEKNANESLQISWSTTL